MFVCYNSGIVKPKRKKSSGVAPVAASSPGDPPSINRTNFVRYASLTNNVNKFDNKRFGRELKPVTDVDIASPFQREKGGGPPVGSKLTLEQQGLVARVGSGDCGPSLEDLAKLNTPGITDQRARQIVHDLNVGLRRVMDECGLTDKVLVTRYLRPALEAREERFFPMPTDDDPTNIEVRKTKAWTPRMRALDMALRLRGDYAPTRANLDVSGKIDIADRVREARERVTRLSQQVVVNVGSNLQVTEASRMDHGSGDLEPTALGSNGERQ